MREIWLNGERADWDTATVHVWDEIAIRGVSVFEGMLFPWVAKGSCHTAVRSEAHLRRLRRSASITRVNVPFDDADLDRVLVEASELFDGRTFYARPTIYSVSGRGPSASAGIEGWFVGAFEVDLQRDDSLRTATLIWPSRSGGVVPPDAKTGGSYLDFRIIAAKRASANADIGILMDRDDNLVEAEGAGVILIENGIVSVPPCPGHALDSITRQIVVELAEEAGLPVVHRPVHWSQAHGSVILATGTLLGVTLNVLDEATLEPLPRDIASARMLQSLYYERLTAGAFTMDERPVR